MTTTPTTVAGLKKLTAPKLKEIAGEIFDADELKGLRKQELVELLAEHYAREKVQDQLTDASDELDDDELDDDEELDSPASADSADDEADDEVDDTPAEAPAAPPEPSGDTLTAKQVATRIGTDAKTLRKFFRSPASTVEAVGQGGRYEFAKEDLEQIRAEFTKWNTNKPTRAAKGTKKADAEPRRKTEDAVPEEDLELDDEIIEPSADELDDDEIELDDDELDLELDDEED